MISKTNLHEYEFNTIEEYFDYIIESKTNGQHTQARELFNDLSEHQKRQFYDYLETLMYYEMHDNGKMWWEEFTQIRAYFEPKK